MAYSKNPTWQNSPSTATPVTAAALNAIENGLQAAALVADRAAGRKQIARNPELIIDGTIARNANGAPTSFAVVWPDGTPGTYTSLVLNSTFLGAVDSYQVTYGSPVIRTYTQPAVTRDATGAATIVPDITES